MQVATSRMLFIPAAQPIEMPVRNEGRLINREQGMALEQLAHAIEYLEDEMVAPAAEPFATRELLDACEAIEKLKALHRGLWYSLPLRMPFWRRIMQWHHRPAQVITLPSL